MIKNNLFPDICLNLFGKYLGSVDIGKIIWYRIDIEESPDMDFINKHVQTVINSLKAIRESGDFDDIFIGNLDGQLGKFYPESWWAKQGFEVQADGHYYHLAAR